MTEMLRMLDVMEGARNCAEYANVKKGEKVLVLTDTKSDFRQSEAIAMACREMGTEVMIMIMKPQDLPNQEPPRAVAEAMKAVDVIFAQLYYTISHTEARFAANRAGAGYLGMYASELDSLASEGARFPNEIIMEVAKKVGKQWQSGKVIRVTCDKGTDLSAKIFDPYKNVVAGEGLVVEEGGEPVFFRRGKTKPGEWHGLFANFAGGWGVVGMWPAWTAEGVIYFDAAHTFKGRLRTPVKYTVEKGRVVKFEGEPEHVNFYEGIIKRFGENARHVAELMIGLNPKTRIYLEDPTHMEAHRHAGSLHCAIGMSTDMDRTVNPGIHLDNWIEKPTVYIDDQVCVDRGKLMVYYNDPEILALLKKYGITL
jgi:leucyl aminopeptidase (aminopeptidase T)